MAGRDAQPTIELICENGHKSVHSLARVYARNDAHCPVCKIGLELDPEQRAAIKAGVDAFADDLNKGIARAVRGIKGLTYTPKR